MNCVVLKRLEFRTTCETLCSYSPLLGKFLKTFTPSQFGTLTHSSLKLKTTELEEKYVLNLFIKCDLA